MTAGVGGQDGAPPGRKRTPGGHPALLLHGQPGSARDWEPVIEAIGGRVATIAIERPGWDGRSQPGGLGVSSDAALAALDARGLERAVIVGVSYGGAVAAWFAVHHPDRVEALVLIAPAANRDSLTLLDRVLAAPVTGYLTSAVILSATGAALSTGWVRRRVRRTLALPDDYLKLTARRLRGRSSRRSFFVEQRALVRDIPLLEQRLGEITAPTTVVVGTLDTVVPVGAGRRLAGQVAGAELIEIESGHHALFAEHPERIAELIVAAAFV